MTFPGIKKPIRRGPRGGDQKGPLEWHRSGHKNRNDCRVEIVLFLVFRLAPPSSYHDGFGSFHCRKRHTGWINQFVACPTEKQIGPNEHTLLHWVGSVRASIVVVPQLLLQLLLWLLVTGRCRSLGSQTHLTRCCFINPLHIPCFCLAPPHLFAIGRRRIGSRVHPSRHLAVQIQF